jgi:O-antigen/teichoic acid export membrane protein
VLELGISATTVREVSRHFDSEPAYTTALIQTASFLYWAMGIVIVVVIFLGAPVLVKNWINLTSIDAGTATTMIRIMSLSTMVVLPRALYTSLFRGRQRMAVNNTIDVVAAVAQQVGIVVLLKLGGGAFTFAAWISASALVAVFAYMVVASRSFGWRALVPRFDPEVVRRNLRFATLMMSNSLLSLVHTSADKVIVSKLLPVADFGFYGFASGTVGRAGFVTTAITQAGFPALSSLHEAGDRVGLLRQYRKLQDLVCFVTLPMFAGICFAARPVYTYLFNPIVAERLVLPTILLALGFYMNAALNTPYVTSLAVGKPQIAARANVVALFVVLPVTVALIAFYGIAGAAASWVFYHLFAFAYLVPMICRQCLDVSPMRWYAHFLRAFAPAVVAYGLSWFVIATPGSFSPLALALAYIVGTALFAVAAYFLIGPDLRDTVINLRQALRLQRARAQ